MANLSVGGPYCARHDQSYTALKPCQLCFADPPPDIDAEQLPEVDPHLLEHEAWLLTGRDELSTLAETLVASDDISRIAVSNSIKAREGALKYERLYLEVYNARKQLEHDRELIGHDKEMAGIGRVQ